MNTMLHWSPTRQFHLHHEADDLFERFFYGTRDEAAQRAPLLPAVEGRIEDGTYVMQFSLAGVDPKDVAVSLMDNVLTVKGERKAGDAEDDRSQGRMIEAGRDRGRAGRHRHGPGGSRCR